MICFSSGKCQIIHWRQGHKEECCPPSAAYHINDDGGCSSQNVAKENQYDMHGDIYGNAPVQTSSEGPVLSDTGSDQGVPCIKGDDIKVGSVADTEGTSSISESLDTSFSGFSTSPIGSESSDDVSVGGSMSSNGVSVNDSISSNESEGSDIQISSDAAPDVVESGLKKVDHTKPLSPKFVRLINSVDSFNKFSKLNSSKSLSNDGESQCASTDIPGPSSNTIHDGSITRPGKVSPGFWDRSLRFVVTSNAVQDDPEMSTSRKAANINSESFLQFKFDLSGSNIPSSNAQSSEMKGIRSDNAHQAVMESSSPVDGAVVSEDTCDNTPKVRRCASVSCGKSSHMDNESNHDLNVAKTTTLESVPSSSSYAHLPLSRGGAQHTVDSNVSESCDLKSPPLSSNQSNTIVKDIGCTSHVPKSRVSSSALQTRLGVKDNAHSVLSVKSEQVDNVEVVDAVTTSPTTSGLKSSMMQKVVDQLRGPSCGKYNNKV